MYIIYTSNIIIIVNIGLFTWTTYLNLKSCNNIFIYNKKKIYIYIYIFINDYFNKYIYHKIN